MGYIPLCTIYIAIGGEKLQKIHFWSPLPLATSKLIGDNREFDDSASFWAVLLIVEGGKLQNIKDLSLIILGYQLLPLATSQLMGDNKELKDVAIFWAVLFIVGGGNLQNIEISSLIILGYQLLCLATSQLMGDNKELMIQPYFELFYSLSDRESFRILKIDHWPSLVSIVAPSNQ